MFKSTHPTTETIKDVLGCLESRVTSAMNDELTKPFTSEEVEQALKQMHTLKSPGSDSYELNHFLKYKTWGKKGHISLKLDISKAYDRVEWCFLERVMVRLGFHQRLVSLIMTCVSSVSFSFLLNEAFSGLIRKAESEGTIQGVAVYRSAPPISHLLFVDDTLIFCQATQEALARLHLILHFFENASGLIINKQKSAMVFSRNVGNSVRLELAGILGVAVVANHDKYLGLPTVNGRSKKEMFDGIKERIRQKLHSWSTKKLSQAGRSVLLKLGVLLLAGTRTEILPRLFFLRISPGLVSVLYLAFAMGYRGCLGSGTSLESGECFARLVWAISELPWGSIACAAHSTEGWFRGVHRELGRRDWDLSYRLLGYLVEKKPAMV
ncbi:UNVERIFIED_CONTAM: hypothetical protein Slati_2674200 [Sesamum latifolium]|uniref:Reverse transcriptase domain-containing protein n=1 Tax=Sesamum latifolium TaxID=2727402 RepID=A0AAW2VUN0_9LAMI